MGKTISRETGGESKWRLSPALERKGRQMGYGALIRKLKSAALGRPTREARSFFRLCGKLRCKLLAAQPALDRKLVGRVATDLVETVDCARRLSTRLRDITRASGRGRRGQIRVTLGLIHDIELFILRPRVERLWRDVPRLFEQLGGNPREDLVLPRRRAASRDQSSNQKS
jgi:hypothetical protein